MDCTSNKSVCQKAAIGGYPTLKVYMDGEEVETYRGGHVDSDAYVRLSTAQQPGLPIQPLAAGRIAGCHQPCDAPHSSALMQALEIRPA